MAPKKNPYILGTPRKPGGGRSDETATPPTRSNGKERTKFDAAITTEALLTEVPTTLKRRHENDDDTPTKRPATKHKAVAYEYDPDAEIDTTVGSGAFRKVNSDDSVLKSMMLTPREMHVLAIAWDNMRDPTIDYQKVAEASEYTPGTARISMGKIKRKLANAVKAELERAKIEGTLLHIKGKKRGAKSDVPNKPSETPQPVGVGDNNEAADEVSQKEDDVDAAEDGGDDNHDDGKIYQAEDDGEEE